MREDVVFKGSKIGLQLFLNEDNDFKSLTDKLIAKLDASIEFFGKGTVVNFLPKGITNEQLMELNNIFDNHGLSLKIVEEEQIPENHILNDDIEDATVQHELLVVDKTVRGGQEIVNFGSILINGDVNPGAKIIAGGNIEIKGVCRGIVHAGAFGDSSATIIAEKLLASQIRISDLIARAPDVLEQVQGAEMASIKDGNIVINVINS